MRSRRCSAPIPKKALDDDLLRLRSLLEEGKATAHGRKVTRDEVPVMPIAVDDRTVRTTG